MKNVVTIVFLAFLITLALNGCSIDSTDEVQALYVKATELEMANQTDDAIKVYDEYIKRSSSNPSEQEEYVVRSYRSIIEILNKQGRQSEKIEYLNAFIDKFSKPSNLQQEEAVADALVLKGVTLYKLNKIDDAIIAYDKTITKFNNTSDLMTQVHVAESLSNKGIALMAQNKFDESLLCFDEVINRFGWSTNSVFFEAVSLAKSNKELALSAKKPL